MNYALSECFRRRSFRHFKMSTMRTLARTSRIRTSLGLRHFQTTTDEYHPTKEDALLAAAIRFVPEVGWSTEAIRLAGKEKGYESPMIHAAFNRGAQDLADFWLQSTTRAIKQQKGTLEELVNTRLQFNMDTSKVLSGPSTNLVPTLSQLVGVLASSPTLASHHLSHLVNALWHQSGDDATHFDWYIKRGALATIYASSELFMSQDKSADYADTFAFVSRRLGEMQSTGKSINETSIFVKFQLRSFLNVLASRR